jgi:hypothetical protein
MAVHETEDKQSNTIMKYEVNREHANVWPHSCYISALNKAKNSIKNSASCKIQIVYHIQSPTLQNHAESGSESGLNYKMKSFILNSKKMFESCKKHRNAEGGGVLLMETRA